jgi:hypothetical protein
MARPLRAFGPTSSSRTPRPDARISGAGLVTRAPACDKIVPPVLSPQTELTTDPVLKGHLEHIADAFVQSNWQFLYFAFFFGLKSCIKIPPITIMIMPHHTGA